MCVLYLSGLEKMAGLFTLLGLELVLPKGTRTLVSSRRQDSRWDPDSPIFGFLSSYLLAVFLYFFCSDKPWVKRELFKN